VVVEISSLCAIAKHFAVNMKDDQRLGEEVVARSLRTVISAAIVARGLHSAQLSIEMYRKEQRQSYGHWACS